LDWSFAHLIAPVVTTTSIILSSNKIQNGHILLPANPGPPGNGRENGEQERERETERDRERQKVSHYIVKLSMVQSNSHNSGLGELLSKVGHVYATRLRLSLHRLAIGLGR